MKKPKLSKAWMSETLIYLLGTPKFSEILILKKVSVICIQFSKVVFKYLTVILNQRTLCG